MNHPSLMPGQPRTLALVTGAAGGIGRALAQQCVAAGHDLLICADRGPLDEVAFELRAQGASVEAVHADLSCAEGLDRLNQALGGRPVEALLITADPAGRQGFLDQPWDALRHGLHTQAGGLLALLHQVGRAMRERRSGRILIAGALPAGASVPGLEDGLKAFFDSIAGTLREELKHSGVSVTVLMPSPADAQFFGRSSLFDGTLGMGAMRADPCDLAQVAFRAMCEGQGDVVAGFRSRLQALLAAGTPAAAVERSAS